MTISAAECLEFETSREVPWEISSQSSLVSLTKTALFYHLIAIKYNNGSLYFAF